MITDGLYRMVLMDGRKRRNRSTAKDYKRKRNHVLLKEFNFYDFNGVMTSRVWIEW